MFRDPVPAGDVLLISNVLPAWDVPECRQLVGRAFRRKRGGPWTGSAAVERTEEERSHRRDAAPPT